MNLDLMHNPSFYIGKTVSVNLDNWIITFTCPALSPDAEFIAAPLFNHTCEIVEGDQILVIKPNDTFSDNLFYHPITLRKFIGMKNDQSYIDMTDKDRIYIHAPITIELTAGTGHITVTNNSISVQGNLDVYGNLGQYNAFTGTILDKSGISHQVKNGIVLS